MQAGTDRIIFENRQEVKEAMDALEDLWEYRQHSLYTKSKCVDDGYVGVLLDILGTMYREWQKPL